ncbi:short-chain dehydrogenase/reductase, partial [Streptomyces sp. NPDC012888]|uniref:short-chain dehydrogenase/reductase n=1 Tax=Streptomyces sp. NPDC012888 TaxID=3364855 RepID=UPI00367BA931
MKRPRPGPLDGRTAVVTGAARGLGEQLAYALARRGVRVAVVGLEEDRLARLAAALPGGAAWAVDVTDPEALARTAEDVSLRLGPPSVVVANAGVCAGGPLEQEPPETWRRIVEVNLVGSALTARCFLPALDRTRGYFLQVASLAALAPAPLLSAYCASKAGVESFAQCLRAEVAHRGVGVGVAYVGWVGTDMIRAADRTEAFQELRSRMPGPLGSVQDPARVVDRLVRGIEHRAVHVESPPWLWETGKDSPTGREIWKLGICPSMLADPASLT